jgi:serine/threonine-protein kinase
MAEPAPETVRAQVGRILASPGFLNADRLRRFLRFTIEAKLRGEQDQIKEFVIGCEVFDRDGSYDPRLDPIVRVEARRLRIRLAEYYEGPGREDPIRIQFPKGSYVPSLLEAAPRRHLRRYAIGATALTVGVALIGVFAVLQAPRDGAVAVVPARWTWGDAPGLDPIDESLAELVVAETVKRGTMPVIAWPSIAQRRTRPNEIESLGATTLNVAARRDGSRMRITVFLFDSRTRQKRWVQDYFSPDLVAIDAQREIAREIAAGLEKSVRRE